MVRFVPLAAADPVFDLRSTLASGQVFHWDDLGDGLFAGAVGEVPMLLRQSASCGVVEVAAGRGSTETAVVKALAERYLALDDDMAAIRSGFPVGDVHLEAAIAYCPGLRILRQPRWECLATFITSSLKQVGHIRAISRTLRERFGAVARMHGRDFRIYPTPGALVAAGEEALRECGLGYRARSLHEASVAVDSGAVDLEMLAAEPDDAVVREALCALRGVGPKIADCVLLFSYGRLGAFPVDVWVERVLRELYFARRRDVTPRRIREFAQAHFGPHRGYAQQFLFHHARHSYTRGGGFTVSAAGGT